MSFHEHLQSYSMFGLERQLTRQFVRQLVKKADVISIPLDIGSKFLVKI